MKKKPSSKPTASVEVRIELTINAPQQRVWDALVNEVGKWWPASFYTSARTKTFKLEPRLGGLMFEDFGRGEGVVWFTVTGIESPNYLSLVGYMGPPFGGPAASILRIGLTGAGANETKLEIVDALFGQVEGSETESGWRMIFDEHFRAHVESPDSARAKKRAPRS
jgi:uncharacterized protein YndB with AHSA1/START domain